RRHVRHLQDDALQRPVRGGQQDLRPVLERAAVETDGRHHHRRQPLRRVGPRGHAPRQLQVLHDHGDRGLPEQRQLQHHGALTMRTRTRSSRRALVTTLTALATAAAATLTTATTAAAVPDRAAACNGYVGLTFDDGPSGNTTKLLDALRRNGLRATMFNQGQYAAANPSLVRAQVAAGMWVANHSYTHPHLTQLSQAQIDSEISRTQQALANAGGGSPKLFRPPYGETNATVKSVAARYGLTEIIWNVDSQDWNGASTDAIVQSVGRLTNGQVILMHDWPANTLAAVPRIAQSLTARGLCAGMISPQTGRAVAPG
ncbi:LOW QUALITY PROTEIN: endo-1,4-beta-xylanase, partial [Streptomyces viridochromogenes DSM 40736]